MELTIVLSKEDLVPSIITAIQTTMYILRYRLLISLEDETTPYKF